MGSGRTYTDVRVHEWVQIGITVSCSPAEARHKGKECQEAQEPQQEQEPCPLEQSQWPLPGPSPAPERNEQKSDEALEPCPGTERSLSHYL